VLSIPRCNAGCNPLRAELIGSDRCTVPGFTPTSSAPILALCRTLIAAGFNPTTPLECYRRHAGLTRALDWGGRQTARGDPRRRF
jgi:hypothetical protein